MEGPKNIDIVFLVVMGCAAMTLLAGFIIFFVVLYQKKAIIQRKEVESIKAQHEQDLLRKTIEVEEKERERLAKNLHDDLGALISILRLNNSRTAKNISNEKVLSKIHKENNIILNKTSESVRSISKKLASPTLVKLGFAKALKELCNSIHQTGEIEVLFKNEIAPFPNIPQSNAAQLFRICQEILNNIIKHAGATIIYVELIPNESGILIKFEHNGTGINDKDVNDLMIQNKGVGLASVYSRIQIIESSISYSTPEHKNAQIAINYVLNDETKN